MEKVKKKKKKLILPTHQANTLPCHSRPPPAIPQFLSQGSVATEITNRDDIYQVLRSDYSHLPVCMQNSIEQI